MTDGWTQWDNWSPCEKTCGKGRSARRRTCRDDSRADIPPSEKTCKGIQRETRICDSGSCDEVEMIMTEGKDPTGMVKGEMRKGLKAGRNDKNEKRKKKNRKSEL